MKVVKDLAENEQLIAEYCDSSNKASRTAQIEGSASLSEPAKSPSIKPSNSNSGS